MVNPVEEIERFCGPGPFRAAVGDVAPRTTRSRVAEEAATATSGRPGSATAASGRPRSAAVTPGRTGSATAAPVAP